MIGSSCGAGAGLPPNPTTTSAVVVATGVAPQLGAGSTAVEGVLPNPPGVGTAAAAPNPPGAGVPNVDEPNAGGVTVEPTFPNPPNVCEPNEFVTTGALGVGLVGVGGILQPLFAASNAARCASLSPFDNIIPDNVPVKNVAIGIINSKNFWSIGLMALSGCVTNIKEYNTTNTIPVNVNAKQIPIKNFNRAINCSSVYKIG